MSRATPRRPGRRTRADWVELGTTLLREEGPAALTVERLTAAAGLTKGSFYHHFDGIGAFVEALLDAWEEHSTESILHAVEALPPTPERRQRMADLTYAIDLRLETAVRRLAAGDARTAGRLAEVDARREAAVARIVQEDYRVSEEEAGVVARLLYTLHAGVVARAPADPRGFAAPMLALIEAWLGDMASRRGA
ncbi:helix-turn-helix domain-containing protein [Chelatococcus sp. SYSU_G07232]|uniref:Helix-turn-helix domain-containing protein n=1 Tax=Chelatococcus albus TaxID=3047466 RepID=A0ABT7AFH1_9HYPH|nr:TetR/AcrR family transcriptional regulator [Chelatococcus sp. SYSU_G07232]MDJ1158132.1 helix-turn-helix domain-containing protein [Chelatococcus sp. SYSU_G07232]